MIYFLKKYQLTAFALYFVSWLLKEILLKIFFIIGCIVAKCKGELNQYLFDCSYMNDVQGNVVGQHTLNFALVKKGGYKHGNPLESISYVIGRCKLLVKQTRFSKWIEKIFLETAEKDHCRKAVKTLDKKISDRVLNLN